MAGYYIYLISSLPMLNFAARPPVSLERFMGLCREWLSEDDNRVIASCLGPDIHDSKIIQPTLDKWKAFDLALRNELVKIRAQRKKIDPAKYLRRDGFSEPYISHLALNAHRNPSLLESERILDGERWRFLDELAQGHYFDIDSLVVYALKLLILERWDKIQGADKQYLLQELFRG